MEAIVRARVSALAAGALASAALFLGVTVARSTEPVARWACDAEDMVVVIDNTCRHVDMLTHEDLARFAQEGVKP